MDSGHRLNAKRALCCLITFSASFTAWAQVDETACTALLTDEASDENLKQSDKFIECCEDGAFILAHLDYKEICDRVLSEEKSPSSDKETRRQARQDGCEALMESVDFESPPDEELDALIAAGGFENIDELYSHCVKEAFNSRTQIQNVVTEAARTVGQVVIDRAKRIGFRLLKDRMLEGAGCEERKDDDAASKAVELTETCAVLRSVDLEDLLTSPEILLDAAIVDLLSAAADAVLELTDTDLKTMLDDAAVDMGHSSFKALLESLIWTCRTTGADGIHPLLREQFVNAVISKAKRKFPEDGSAAEQVYWAVGRCLVEQGSIHNATQCNFGAYFAEKEKLGAPLQELLAVSRLAATAAATRENEMSPSKAKQTAGLVFALGRTRFSAAGDSVAGRKALEIIDSTENLVSGLTSKDWTAASVGAVRLARIVDSCESFEMDERYFALLAAIGNYSQTYRNKNMSATEQQAARKAVIEELADRAVDRASRRSGMVVSLGGELGVGLSLLGDWSDRFYGGFGTPVRLAIGIGGQTYHEKAVSGLHWSVTALDIGSYVVFENDDLSVEDPEIKSIVTPGLNIGGWFLIQEMPLYLGLQLSVTPFLKDTQGDPLYRIGIGVGFYVPLFDFN